MLITRRREATRTQLTVPAKAIACVLYVKIRSLQIERKTHNDAPPFIGGQKYDLTRVRKARVQREIVGEGLHRASRKLMNV